MLSSADRERSILARIIKLFFKDRYRGGFQMTLRRVLPAAILCAAVLGFGAIGNSDVAFAADAAKPAAKTAKEIPIFEYDPNWPKPLPNAWVTGNIGAMYIGKDDHLWIVQRPNSLVSLGERYKLEGWAECCTPAPPVIEFNPAGEVVQAWGAIHITDPETKKDTLVGKQVSGPYPEGMWPESEHALYIDHKNNVWITSQRDPSQLVKFTRDGKFLLRIGKVEAKSSSDKENLAGPTGVYVDPQTNEVFVSDGYRNRRVVVFDADTGAYKRHWGAYGKPPVDPQQPFSSGRLIKRQPDKLAVVHCIVHSNDGLLYVCDRSNSRIQVFKKDGTYVKEVFVEPRDGGMGTAFTVGFSPDPEQRFLYLGDGSDKKIWILDRKSLEILGTFGTPGREGGRFMVIHSIVTDSKGNLYVGETVDNNRVQRFLYKGLKTVQ
jgi:sugar lactone lactonase YvrE